jgi:aryl-alcohol dehydrogenase-like predicted oxidoreductase
MPYGIGNRGGMPSERESFELLQEAWESGVASYDTAAAYGRSEEVLGRFFAGKRPLIVTKIRVEPQPGDDAERIARQMRERIESSLARLQLKQIPIVLLHNPDVMERWGDAVTAGFRTVIREGLVGRAGISVAHNTKEEYRVLSNYLQDDLYEAVQLQLNVLDHRPIRSGILEMLREAGKIVFARSVFLQGVIYLSEEELSARLPDAAEPVAALRALAEEYGVPLAQAAVSFVRDTPGVTSLVVGAETKEQVRDNAALIAAPAMPEELRERLLERFANVPDRVVTPSMWK